MTALSSTNGDAPATPYSPVLLVDDNASKRLSILSVLEPLGLDVVQADSGEAALREVMGEIFAVILMDVQMPGMNGYEAASLIRMRRQSEHTPIIFITAHAMDEAEIPRAYASGAVDFIFSPFSPGILRAKVSVFVELFLKSRELRQSLHDVTLLNDQFRASDEDRKQAEVASTHFASIVDSSRDAIIGHALGGLITSWNRGAASLYGYPAEAVIGESIVSCVPPGRPDEMSDALAQIERGEVIDHLETVHVDRVGRLVDVELTFSPIRDLDGVLTGISTVARDITEQKLAARNAKAHHEATRVLAEATTLELALPDLLAALGSSMGWSVGAFWMPRDQSDDELECAAFWSAPDVEAGEFRAASEGIAMAPGAGLPGRVWESQVPRWVEDVSAEKHSLRTDAALKDGLHACILLPAVSGGEVVAVIEFLDGEVRPLEQAQLDILSPLSVQIGDFIVRQQGEAALERSERQTRRIIECARDAFVSVDGGGRICDWNSQAETTFGWSREQALGLNASEVIIPESGREEFRRGLERLLARGGGPELEDPLEMTALRRDGSEFTAELTVSFLEGPRGHTLNAFVRDITDRRDHEDALERAIAELDRFAGIASHDLGNPLRTISGFANLLQRNQSADLDERGKEQLDRIIGGAARGQALIDDLLLYAKSGRQDIEAKPIDLGSLVEEVLLDIDHEVAEHSARIEVGDLPEVTGDRGQLKQLMQNLICNALKFCGDEPPVVEISAQRADDRYLVTVADHGVGVPDDERENIFDPFNRTGRTADYPGTGLGLAICARVVERHGGSIRCEPNKPSGTRFIFTLAVAGAAAVPAQLTRV